MPAGAAALRPPGGTHTHTVPLPTAAVGAAVTAAEPWDGELRGQAFARPSVTAAPAPDTSQEIKRN